MYVDPEGYALDVLWDVGAVSYSGYYFVRNPGWDTGLALVVDIGAAFVPFVPSVAGLGVRGARAADKAIDAGKAAKRACRAVKAADEALETHHLLPRAKRFADRWKKAGLDINDPQFTVKLPKGKHRLKAGNGIHTGPDNGNKRWDDFFEENPDPSREEILDNMNKLRKEFGI